MQRDIFSNKPIGVPSLDIALPISAHVSLQSEGLPRHNVRVVLSVASHETLQFSSFLLTSNYFVLSPFSLNPPPNFPCFWLVGSAVALPLSSFFRPAGLGGSKYEELFASLN